MPEPSFWESVVDACPNFLGVAVATAGQTVTDISNGVIQTFKGHGAEVADSFDARATESARWLDSLGNDLVDKFPGKFGVGAAVAVSTLGKATMMFGQGTVDTLRLGTGVAKGTVGGYLEDGLRVLPFIAPGVRTIQELRFARLARLYADPLARAGACVPVSIAKALRFTGQTKAFATLDEMLSGLGRSGRASEIFKEGRCLHETVNDLRRIGAEFKHFRTGQSLTQIENYLRANPKGIMIFGVKFGEGGHALGAKIDFFGKFKIVDRTGKELSTLKEIEAIGPGYAGIASGTIQNTAMYIPQARYLQRAGQGAAALAFELNVVAAKVRNKSSLRPVYRMAK